MFPLRKKVVPEAEINTNQFFSHITSMISLFMF